MTEPSKQDVNEWHRRFGIELFNQTWDLLDTADRTTDQNAEMLATALGSRHHWRQIGEPKNYAISDWQVSRVFAVCDAPELARGFAQQSLDLCRRHELGPYLTGYAYEGLARAAFAAGDEALAHEHMRAARELAAEVEDGDSRALLSGDLDELEA